MVEVFVGKVKKHEININIMGTLAHSSGEIVSLAKSFLTPNIGVMFMKACLSPLNISLFNAPLTTILPPLLSGYLLFCFHSELMDCADCSRFFLLLPHISKYSCQVSHIFNILTSNEHIMIELSLCFEHL